jgi:hypothetical protein
VHIPAKARLPRLDQLKVEWHGRQFLLPYLYREGNGGPIPASARFFFYDNPVDTFQAIGEFVHAHQINPVPTQPITEK